MFDTDVRDIEDGDIGRALSVRNRAGRRIAALDVGSRSFHLLVAELRGADDFEVVCRAKERVLVGESVFAGGAIDAESFAQGIAAVRRLRELALDHAPTAVTAVATSAVRDARNGQAFVRAVHQRAGIHVRVIDGLEEARLALLGARRELGDTAGRFCLVDFGGGSTEIVVADHERCYSTLSLPVGLVRLCARHAGADLRDGRQLGRFQAHVAYELGRSAAQLRVQGFEQVVFACGTARRLAKLADAARDAALERRVELGRNELVRLREAQRALSGPLEPGADTARKELIAGASVLQILLDLLGVDRARIVQAGLREGLVVDHLGRARLNALAPDALHALAPP